MILSSVDCASLLATVLHGGPAFPLLSQALYRYISIGIVDEVFVMTNSEDFPDLKIADAIAVYFYTYIGICVDCSAA